MRAAMLVLAGACVCVALTAPLWPLVYHSAVANIVPAGFPDTGAGLDQAKLVLGIVCAAFWILLAVVGLLAWVPAQTSVRADGSTAGRRGTAVTSLPRPGCSIRRLPLRARCCSCFACCSGRTLHIHPPLGLFPEQASFESHTPDVFHDYLFRPIFAAIVWTASKLRWFQNGRLQLYVLYIALTILVLLVWKLG